MIAVITVTNYMKCFMIQNLGSCWNFPEPGKEWVAGSNGYILNYNNNKVLFKESLISRLSFVLFIIMGSVLA